MTAEDRFSGDETWGCRKKHLAVVNSVCQIPSEDVISLRGDWQFLARRHDQNTRRNSHDHPFFPDVAPWGEARKLCVPGCWEAQGVGEPGISEPWSFRLDCSQKPLRHVFFGEGWYRTTVKIPEAWNGKRIWLKIGGVNAQGWFWVNRQQVAHVANYCGTYKYDVTDCVTPGGEAEIIAEVDNLLRGRKGCFNNVNRWGGIYRDVELEATPQTFIDDAWVRGDFDGKCAEAHVAVGKATAPCQIRFTVDGKTVNAAVAPEDETVVRLPLAELRPWSPERPNLYTGIIELVENGRVVQTRRERFGVRKLEVRGKEFYLNGNPYFLRGFGDDSVYPLTGVPPADRGFHLRNLSQARAAGFNFVRLHTHCEVPEYFEAADEAGILVQPELPYINGDIPTEEVEFDPVKDMLELHRNFRRHPSFAVSSNGNEGSFGRRLDEYLYRLAKNLDPDRLKIGMDTQFAKFNPKGTSDYEGGPVTEWPRGSINPDRPFMCHEYLNRTVKLDARLETRFSGAWAPPVTRGQRQEFLADAGLDDGWGVLLQRAQHALQRHWHKSGVESARSDPFCDGYCLWTIVDVVVRQRNTFTAQGVFNPFWETKECGATPESLARFNSPSVVLFDVPGNECVFRSGESIEMDFLLAHYGECLLGPDARLEWRLAADGKVLLSGDAPVGAQELGPARKVAHVKIAFPDVPKAVKATLTAHVGGTGNNDREFWIFPRREMPDGSFLAVSDALRPSFAKLFRNVRGASDAERAEIVVAEVDSPLLAAATGRGQRTIAIGDVNRSPASECKVWSLGREISAGSQNDYRQPSPDISLGWWSMGAQVGTALKKHPALALLPHEGFLSPLLFGTIGKGRKLPFAGADAKTLIIAGEGGDSCYAYMAELENGRQIATWGLDLTSGRPEATAILDGIISYNATGILQRAVLSTGVEIPAEGVPTNEGGHQYTTRMEKRPETISNESAYLKWKWRMNLANPKTGLDNEALCAGVQKIVEESAWKSGREDWYDVAARCFDFLVDNVAIGFSRYDCFPAVSAWDRHRRPMSAILWSHAADVDDKYSPGLRTEIAKMAEEGRASIGKDFDHSAPDWAEILKLGFPGLKARADSYTQDTPFYRAERRAAAAMMRFLDRLIAEGKRELEKISLRETKWLEKEIASLERLRVGPPQTVFDVMEFTMVYFILSEPLNYFQVRTFDNIDVRWWPYYQADLAAGRTTEAEFREEFRHFLWQFGSIDNYWGHPIYLGGTNRDGSTAYNPLSLIILDVVEKTALPTPKFQLKMAKNTPDEIWWKALDMLRKHAPLCLMSEENMARSMKLVGLTDEECRDLLIWGCFEYLPRAKGNCTSATDVYLQQPIEEMLAAARASGKGNGKEWMETFDAFKGEYLRRLKVNTDRVVELVRENERHLAEINPALMLSLAVGDAMEKGVDAFSLGYKYNFTALSETGFATAVDSLLAVKEFVYDKKMVSLRELGEILAADWKGHEELRLRMKNSKFKWGCGNPEADALAKEVQEGFSGCFVGKPNSRGGVFVCYGLNSRGFIRGGMKAGATPDGRHKGEHLSKNMAPSVGAETEGITGSIKSYGALAPENFPCGSIYDVMIHPSTVAGDKGLRVFRMLVERFFAGGGVAMNINIVSPETLRDAQAHPEKYENLQVRVAGWNIRWNDIPRKEQDEYIARIETVGSAL